MCRACDRLSLGRETCYSRPVLGYEIGDQSQQGLTTVYLGHFTSCSEPLWVSVISIDLCIKDPLYAAYSLLVDRYRNYHQLSRNVSSQYITIFMTGQTFMLIIFQLSWYTHNTPEYCLYDSALLPPLYPFNVFPLYGTWVSICLEEADTGVAYLLNILPFFTLLKIHVISINETRICCVNICKCHYPLLTRGWEGKHRFSIFIAQRIEA